MTIRLPFFCRDSFILGGSDEFLETRFLLGMSMLLLSLLRPVDNARDGRLDKLFLLFTGFFILAAWEGEVTDTAGGGLEDTLEPGTTSFFKLNLSSRTLAGSRDFLLADTEGWTLPLGNDDDVVVVGDLIMALLLVLTKTGLRRGGFFRCTLVLKTLLDNTGLGFRLGFWGLLSSSSTTFSLGNSSTSTCLASEHNIVSISFSKVDITLFGDWHK